MKLEDLKVGYEFPYSEYTAKVVRVMEKIVLVDLYNAKAKKNARVGNKSISNYPILLKQILK